MTKFIKGVFFVFVCLSVSAALWVFKDLLFPFVTSKAFFFRIAIELALPFYLYLIVSNAKLRPGLKNPLNILALIFLVINIASSFTGVSVIRSLFGNFERMGGAYYIGHLVALYFYVLALGQMGGLYLQRFLKFFLFMTFIVTGNGIFGWLHWPTFVQDPSLPDRLSSTLGNPIYLGSYLIIPLFLALFFSFQSESKASKAGYGVLSLLFLLGIFLSGTRGAVVGLVIGSFICAVLYLFLSDNKKIKQYGFVGVGVFVILMAVLFSVSGKLPQGSGIQRLFKLKDSNAEARLLQWQIALKGFPDRPLLGTGPENYYIVANQYYNQEVYKYDRSWFDKPHNYLLEILVTNGILGFLAYAGILGCMGYALHKAYKAGLFGPAEFAVLLAALLVYQIQNLFVFDTVPASLTFYTFLGFAGYLWEVFGRDFKKEKSSSKMAGKALEPFPVAVFMAALPVMAYAIYATNAVPMQISKNVNYGYAYAGIDINKSVGYFKTATSLPFNFDKTETASKFADFTTNYLRTATAANKNSALKILDDSTGYMEEAIAAQPDNPILWQRLSTLYLYKSVEQSGKAVIDPRAEEAVNKVIELAPKREESYLALAQIKGVEGKLEESQKILEDTVAIFSGDLNLKIQLANTYRAQNKLDRAAALTEQALEKNYVFGSYGEMKWLIDYYVKNSKFDKALALQEKAAKVEPNNIQVVVDTANLYYLLGKNSEARSLAQQIINYDSTKKSELQNILNSVSSTTPDSRK